MVGIFAATTDLWAPLGAFGVPIFLMFGWLKLDIRDLGRRLERLEDSHAQTEKAAAWLQGANQGHSPPKWEG